MCLKSCLLTVTAEKQGLLAATLMLQIIALPAGVHAFVDEADVNGFLAPGSQDDPPIEVNAGWSATTATPPAFFWSGCCQPFNNEGPFTFSSEVPVVVTVTDDFCRGDQFRIYDNNVAIGETSPVDEGGCLAIGPDAAFADEEFSSGCFQLGPGSHAITIQVIVSPFGGGRGYIRVDTLDNTICALGAVLDIKPGSCPNSFNRNSHGVLPVALAGDPAFDVGLVDLTTVRLERADGIGGSVQLNEGPPGPHSVFEDVATPFNGELCDCHELTGDGIDDLSMKFKSQEVIAALELSDVPPGALVELCVSGELPDGTEFEACDCVRLVPPGDIDGDGLVGIADLLRLLAEWGACGPTAECSADYNGDAMVAVVDLLIMLGNWG